MGIDLTTLLAGLTGGAQGMGTAVQQDEARKRQMAVDAMNAAVHQATMDKIKVDAQHQQGEDYLKGIRQGVAPDGSAINAGMDVAASVAGGGVPGVAGVAPSLAVQAMRQAAPGQYAPDRFQQIDPSRYVDTTATPEAIAERARVAAAKIQADRDAATRGPVPGSPEWKQMEITKAKIGAEYGYHPPVQPSFTPVTVQSSADAPPEIKPFNTKTGTVGPTIGGAKQATRIESATNTAAKARLEAAVSEMNNAHKGMEEYENALRNGTANINGLQQFASRVANSFTHDDPVSMTIQSTALATLNRTNPELARYIRRALSFAEGESMISQRPSDFRTKMSAFLSAAASGASPEMIHDIEQRRTSILDPLNRTVQPGPTRASAPSSGDVDLSQPASRPPLAERIQQLRQQGLSKEAAKAQLQQEGYDLHGGE